MQDRVELAGPLVEEEHHAVATLDAELPVQGEPRSDLDDVAITTTDVAVLDVHFTGRGVVEDELSNRWNHALTTRVREEARLHFLEKIDVGHHGLDLGQTDRTDGGHFRTSHRTLLETLAPQRTIATRFPA